MSFQLNEPVLVIGLGGIGSKLVSEISKNLDFDSLVISPDSKDLTADSSIKIPTGSLVNPSVYSIRGFANRESETIRSKITKYSSVILLANLAGKTGSAIAPVVSQICKQENKNVISFAIMPFKFEKDRIFISGISLKRLQADSNCTIVVDNDALLDSNPDLTPNACHKITNSAILHVVNSIKSSQIPEDTSILSTSKISEDMEASLRDSLKMLYSNVTPNSVKRSIMYLLGGNDVPVGVLNSVSSIASGVVNEETSVDVSNSDESKVLMVSNIQGQTRFEKYDPLGVIPSENTLDWDEPECSYNCILDLYQLE